MAGQTFKLITLDDQAATNFNELLGIDNAGTLVGYFGNGISPDPFPTAVALSIPYSAPQYRTLATGSYTVSGASTEAGAINNLGLIVGSGSTVVGAASSGIVLGNVTAPATSAAAGFARVLGVNDQGDKVGYGQSGTVTGAVVSIQGGSATTLTALPVTGGSATIHALQATGVNNADIITGFGTVAGGATEGFVYNKATGNVVALTGPSGASFTEALGLNNENQVVGDYRDSSGTLHGFVYDEATGTYVTIDATQSATTIPVTGTVVNGINDLGQIVGYYTTGDGATHGMLGYVPGSQVNVDNPSAGSTIEVGPEMRLLALGGSNGVTLIDPGIGSVILFANTGADTINAYGAADTVVGGSGNESITATGGSALIYLGAGSSTVSAVSSATVVAGGASATVRDYGGGLIVAGAGNMTVSGAAATSPAPATIVGGSGALFAYAGDAAGSVVFGGSGSSTIAGGAGRSSLVGGSGAATIYAGSGGGLIWGGTSTCVYVGDNAASGAAPTLIVAGGGASTVYAAAGNTVFLTGSSSDFVADVAGNTVTGGATLVASGSGGDDVFQLGAGHDIVYTGTGTTDIAFAGKGASTIVGGSGRDTYTFASLPGGGGAYTVYNFQQGSDLISLTGNYSATEAKTDLAGASFARGDTKLTLGDKTQITFVGVHLTLGDFR